MWCTFVVNECTTSLVEWHIPICTYIMLCVYFPWPSSVSCCTGTVCVMQVMEWLCQWMTSSSSWWQQLWRSVLYIVLWLPWPSIIHCNSLDLPLCHLHWHCVCDVGNGVAVSVNDIIIKLVATTLLRQLCMWRPGTPYAEICSSFDHILCEDRWYGKHSCVDSGDRM